MMRALLVVSYIVGSALGFETRALFPRGGRRRAYYGRGMVGSRRRIRWPKESAAPNNNDAFLLLLGASLINVVDEFFVKSPYTAAAIVCGVKASAADGVAQFQEWKDGLLEEKSDANANDEDGNDAKKEEEEEGMGADFKRNAAFVTYGALYQGLTQEFIYNHLYPVWFGTGTAWTVVLTKVAFSLLVQTTLLTLPSLYLIKAIIEQMPLNQALGKYISDIKNQRLLQKFYLLWGPVLTLTFSVVPEQWRVTFIALVSFFWLIILSGISSGISPADKDQFCTIGQDFCEFEKPT